MRFALALPLLLSAAPALAVECRQALAIGLDVSRSVDAVEYRLQVQGMAAALTDPEVAALILETPETPVWIAVFLWSGRGEHQLIADWTPVEDEDVLNGLAATIATTRRANLPASTAVGEALVYGDALLGGAGPCPIRTLDVAGDGKNNTGPAPRSVSLPHTDIVNALAVGLASRDGFQHGEPEIGELVAWFRADVIRGPGAFVEAAVGYADFSKAMTRKLKRELAGAVVGSVKVNICVFC